MEQGFDFGQLGLAADEGGSRGGQVGERQAALERLGGRWGGEGAGWQCGQGAGLELQKQAGRLGLGIDAKLGLEDFLAILVLAQGGIALPGSSVGLHQGAVGVFVEQVHRQPAAGGGDRGVVLTGSAVGCRQALQSAGQLGFELLGLEELPFIKGGAVAQAKAGQEIGAVYTDGFFEQGDAGRAGLVGRVGMAAGLGQGSAELPQIDA